jgi:hypothetical protein
LNACKARRVTAARPPTSSLNVFLSEPLFVGRLPACCRGTVQDRRIVVFAINARAPVPNTLPPFYARCDPPKGLLMVTKANPPTGPAAPKRKAVRKKKAAKRPGAIQRIENALLAGAAEIDELAADLGFLGAVPPAKKRKPRRTKKA